MRAALFLSVLLLTSCTDAERARSTLEGAGYTDIQIGGRAWNSCSKDDDSCTSFTARGPSGRPVKGAVGCGLSGCGKGCTIRID